MSDESPGYDPSSALIVVDVQNDFADPAGGLYVRDGERTVPLINDHLTRARAAGARVVYTQDWHPETTPHFAKDGGVWPVHCVHDTWGAALHPGLTPPEPDDAVVRKGTGGEDGYSGFSVRDPVSGERRDTGLDFVLRRAGVRRVVVVGLAGDYCVKETALDARRLGYATEVPLAATRFVNLAPGDDEKALAELTAAGVVVR